MSGLRNVKKKIRRMIRKVIERCLQLNKIDVISKIKKAEVISFDIFDTLVKRDVKSPEDMHVLVGLKFAERTGRAIKKYDRCREQAEYDAKKHAMRNEITLQEIFDQMENISERDKKTLFELEQELEYEICHQNMEMKKIYDIAYSMKKHIVITSDMYLPESLIQRILEKCGYKGYEKIYLSSSYGETKSSGKLFKCLKEDYREASDRILHIGDNAKGDFYRAKQMGINAILIGREKRKVRFYKKSQMRTWKEKCFYEFLNNHKLSNGNQNEVEKNRDEFARALGYEVLGPILWGYIQWLQKQLKADEVEKIFFLSREGALLQKAYQIIFPDSRVVQKYLYVSRQALQVPMLSECLNYYEMIQIIKPMMHNHTLDNIGRECDFDSSYWEGCKELNLDIKSSIFDITLEKQTLYYDLLYRLGKQKFREQRELVRAYLKQEEFEGKIAVADIGWQGTMQKALSVYCGTEKYVGYYIGVRNVRAEEYYEGLKRKGYLFEPGRHEEWNLKMRFTTEIMETLFLNRDGSVTGYCKKGNRVKPCLRENEHQCNTGDFLREVQTAALQFLDDWKKSVLSDYEMTCETVMKGYESFAVKPNLRTVNYFKDFSFFDGGTKKILPTQSLFYYICHPKKMLIDMNASTCKIFALKKLFKLPLPYYHLLRLFLYRLKIKSPYGKNMEQ